MEKLKFTDEEIARANNVDIVNYAINVGYDVKKDSQHSYKIEGYGGLCIDANGHKWNWFSQGNKGGGPIQFVMEMEKKNWVEAVKTLIGKAEEIKKLPQRDDEKEKESNREFVLPEKNSTYKHIFAYLINSRGIDKNIVNDFVKQHKLYENTYKNCVFVGYDKDGVAKHASVRSTNTIGNSFRADVSNSKKEFPFCREGTNNTVNIFEAPIDLISYLTLIKIHNVKNFNNHMIDLDGVSDKALENYLKEHPNIDKIMLCLDNDNAGNTACKNIAQKYGDRYTIQRHSPKTKDFNQDLQETLKLKQICNSEKNEPGQSENKNELIEEQEIEVG